MNPQEIRIIFTIVAVVWVGGGGWLMFRYPQFFARINARFRFKAFATPRSITFTRRMGIVEMVLAAIAAVNGLLLPALGIKWY